jgi:glycerol kinase
VKKFLVAIDQGTTSSRAILFSLSGKPIYTSQKEFKQYFPKNGWVEHNPNEIWSTVKKVLFDVIVKSKKLKGEIISIGITNQRETTILWDKKTGKHIYNAIVWQDRRTEDYCKKIKKKEKLIRKKTGLFIDPYFSATKIKWILENIPKAKNLLKKKQLLFGTIDSFLIWKLTEGKVHATDATNASRTMLFNINKNNWDNDILKIFKINKNILPIVKNSADDFGSTSKKVIGEKIPISAVLGDQQAAAFGQACFKKGSVKSTYGTGAFVIMNTGNKKLISKNKLLTTICYRLNNKNTFAIEGSIFVAGAGVQWLRDKIKLINNAYETEKIAKSRENNDGVYIVPAFTGLGAPYWNSSSRGLITGLTRNSDWKDLVRAIIESVAYQSYDLFESMRKDGLKPKIIKVDGGMVANNWFSQFLSNIIDTKVIRPKVKETTALGVAFMAGLKIGVYKSLSDISNYWEIDKKFTPKISKSYRTKLLKGWQQAIRKTLV